MSVAQPLVLPDLRASTADRVTRGIAVALAAYLAATIWPLWRDARSTGALIPIATHLAMLAYVLVLLVARGAARRPALDWLVLTIGPLMYVELRRIIAGAGMPPHDPTIVSWERVPFPSSHVAASLVSALCALRYQRRVGAIVAPIVAALVLATVYGGFHYAVDALVGVILGGLAWLASATLWRVTASRGEHTATAA